MHYVYVLRSKADGNLYVGFTENLRQRLLAHNSGKNPSTQLRKPLELIFYEAFVNRFDALRRERYFKTTKGKTALRQMVREGIGNLPTPTI